ncbi:hypothetical protein ABZY03_01960 [Streptomyces klenkii]|uniref:glycoside hydrolase family 113 n=1 Tax=Streptomyces klenkii TaxID=1420899 RepID=UPI0033A80CB7
MSAGRRAAGALLAAALLLAGCLTGCSSGGPDGDSGEETPPGPSARPDDGKAPGVRGITLPSWNTGDYAGPDAAPYLRQIAATGARWVTFTPTWYQDGTGDPGMHTTGETAGDDALRHIIGLAHETGLKVMLKPHVDLVKGGDRAGIRPGDPGAWFTAYERFITHYATLAADTKTEQLAVGTELAGTSRDGARWSKVVRAVRDRYRGPLTYAANYDEYRTVAFWDDLDVIGIDAYWPLAERPTADAARLRDAWKPITGELAAFSARHHRKILFTEAGYVSQRGTTTAPYSWTVSKSAGEDEQAAAYEALLTALDGRPWWAGVCWWMWDDWPDAGETPRRLAYTPHGKPAETVLRQHWK